MPEVNELYRGAARSGTHWYYERQVDRYAMARTAAERGQSAVLDGDPLQPLWYNWIYPEFGPLVDVVDFFSHAMRTGRIRFPDCYVVLGTSATALRTRKERDETRRRRNFERHLNLIEPQRRYFEALRSEGGVTVHFLQNNEVNDTLQQVARLEALGTVKDTDALRAVAAWLSTHPAPSPA